MKTHVYVDGFNLYYGCLKSTPYRWLNLKSLTEDLIHAKHEITRIKYFTARVKKLPNNPDAPLRQDAYIRALRSLPCVEIYEGHFLTNSTHLPRADGEGWVKVLRTEEKGSDVNLATHLVADGFRNDYEAAVVISNDSDLCEPVRIVAQELGLVVGILVPTARRGRRRSQELCRAATFWKPIRTGAVKANQFPDQVTVNGRSVHRPREWK